MKQANGVACRMLLRGKRCRRRFAVVLGCSEVHLHPRSIPGMGIIVASSPNDASTQVSCGRGKKRALLASLTLT